MRPLSPNDDAARLAEAGWGRSSSETPAHGSSGSSGDAASSIGLREDLVPMQYRGPAQPAPQQPVQVQQQQQRPQQQSLSPARPASSASSGAVQRVTVTASTNSAAPAAAAGGSGGAVLYRQRVPAGAVVQGAAAAGATFQRSMMVAGFEEGEATYGSDL